MGRRRHRQSFKDYASGSVKERVQNRLRNRHWLLGRCPLVASEIAALQFGPEQTAAIKTLQGKGVLVQRHELRMNWDLPLTLDLPPELSATDCPNVTGVSPIAMLLTSPEPMVMFNTTPGYNKKVTTLLVSNLPDVLRETAIEWATNWLNLQLQTNVTYWKVSRALDVCNTMGQIKRLWPSLVGFLPDEAQEKLRQMKMQSRLPDNVLDEGKLDPEWHPEVLAWYENIIVESLLLPDADDDVPGGDHPNRILFNLIR